MEFQVKQEVTIGKGFGEKFPALDRFVGAKGKVAEDDKKKGEVLKGVNKGRIGINVSEGGRIFVDPEDLE